MAQGAGGPIYLGWSWQVSDKVTVERHDRGEKRSHMEI